MISALYVLALLYLIVGATMFILYSAIVADVRPNSRNILEAILVIGFWPLFLIAVVVFVIREICDFLLNKTHR